MEKIITFFFCLFLVLSSGSLQAQLSLSGDAATTVDESPKRVADLIKASDVTTMLPSLDLYKEIIEDMPYSNYEMRQENLANVESNYDEQVALLTANINEFRQKAEVLGLDYTDLTFLDFQMKVKRDHEFFQGGNAVIIIEGNEGEQHTLLVNGLYFMGGEWYVLNKIVLK